MTIKSGDNVRWTFTLPQRGRGQRYQREFFGTVREIYTAKGELRAIVVCEPDCSRRMVRVRELKKIAPRP